MFSFGGSFLNLASVQTSHLLCLFTDDLEPFEVEQFPVVDFLQDPDSMDWTVHVHEELV